MKTPQYKSLREKRLSVIIGEDKSAKVKAKCAEKKKTITNVVNELLDKWLKT